MDSVLKSVFSTTTDSYTMRSAGLEVIICTAEPTPCVGPMRRRLRFDLMGRDAPRRCHSPWCWQVYEKLSSRISAITQPQPVAGLPRCLSWLIRSAVFVAHSVKSLKPMPLGLRVTRALDSGCTVKEWVHTHDAAFRNEGKTSDSCHCGA